MEWVFTIACILALAATLDAEWRHPRRKRIPKMLASTSFVAVALSLGALDTTFGRIMVVGLVLSWLGDLFLTYNGRAPFVAGLVAFLAGHIAYGAAFFHRGLDESFYLLLVAAGVAAIPIMAWLMPTVPKELRTAVAAYIGVISAMVAAAGSTHLDLRDWRIPGGAVAFYLSDIGVARDRFSSPGYINRLIGLPLYFGGQLLLAWASGG